MSASFLVCYLRYIIIHGKSIPKKFRAGCFLVDDFFKKRGQNEDILISQSYERDKQSMHLQGKQSTDLNITEVRCMFRSVFY